MRKQCPLSFGLGTNGYHAGAVDQYHGPHRHHRGAIIFFPNININHVGQVGGQLIPHIAQVIGPIVTQLASLDLLVETSDLIGQPVDLGGHAGQVPISGCSKILETAGQMSETIDEFLRRGNNAGSMAVILRIGSQR